MLRYFLLIGMVVLMTGCGADLIVQTEIHSDGTGTRIVEIVVPDDQMAEVAGGEAELTKAISTGLPDGTSLETIDEDGKTVYRFSYEFQSVDALIEQMAQLTGEPPQIVFEEEGTPFVRSFKFADPVTPGQYLKSIEDAVVAAGIIKEEQATELINSERMMVLLPGMENAEPLFSWDREVDSKYTVPVKSVSVLTDLKTEGKYERVITATVDRNVHDQLESERESQVSNYLANLSDKAQVEVIEADAGPVDYRVTLKADTFEELAAMSTPYIGNESSVWEQANDSKFFPIMRFAERADLAAFLGDRNIVQDGYTYKVLYTGKQVTPLGEEIVGPNGQPAKDEYVVEQPLSRINASLYAQRTSGLYYAVVIGGTAASTAILALIVFIVIRKRRAIADYWLSVRSSAQQLQAVDESRLQRMVPAYCHHCGNRLEPSDLYCHDCGHRTEMKSMRGA